MENQKNKQSEEENIKKAETNYSYYMNIDQKNIEVIDRLSEIYRKTKRLDEALKITVLGVNQNPLYFVGWNNLAWNEIINKRYSIARAFLRECLRINPKHTPAIKNLQQINLILEKK